MVDDKYLEFWGNFFITAAKGKKQFDSFMSSINTLFEGVTGESKNQGLDSFESLLSISRQMAGFDYFQEYGKLMSRMSRNTMREFKDSFKEYLGLMGVVSLEDHLSLIEKYEKLKEKNAEQEETIKHLRMLMDARHLDQGDMLQNFQSMVRDQSDLFQKMMQDFMKMSGGNS